MPQAARPTVQPYQKTYQQGYRAYQPPYTSVPTPLSFTYQQEEQQYSSSYDEQPQATYPEMPQQQQ